MIRNHTGAYMAFALTFLAIAVPHVAFGAGFPVIVAQNGACVCLGSAPDWGCILQVVQNVINAAIELGVVLCVIWIAWGGFSMMISGGSAEARSMAKTRLLNAVVGIAVILCSWLVVDWVMKVVYEPSTAFEGNKFGPWNSILAPTGNDGCIKVTSPSEIATGTVAANLTSSGEVNISSSGTGACSASVVQQGAAAGGYTITNQQANELACIAQHESSCGTANGIGNPNFSWDKASSNGKASTAAGAYQVLLKTNSACYQNPVCTQAAGGQTLNCAQAFDKNGFVTDSALAKKCLVMAGNTSCSAAAAACQLQKQSFTSMYGTDPDVGKCSSGS